MEKLTLDSLDSNELTGGEEFEVIASPNLGKRTLGMSLSLKKFRDMSIVYNAATIEENSLEGTEIDAQRPFDKNHAKKLATYILKGLVHTTIQNIANNGSVPKMISKIQKDLGVMEHSALQPFTTNIRKCQPNGSDLGISYIMESVDGGKPKQVEGIIRVVLKSIHKLSVVDGQHRRAGLDMIYDWLIEVNTSRKYPVKGLFVPANPLGHVMDADSYNFWTSILDIVMSNSFIKIECHLGLNDKQERQLFSDLNSKGKKVDNSLSIEYDSSDSVNNYVKETLIKNGHIKFDFKIKDSKVWQDDDGSMLRKDINPITCMAMFGHATTSKITPAMIERQSVVGIKFWEEVQSIKNFATKGSRSKTVAAQTVVLKGLARLAWDLGHGKSKNEKDLALLWECVGEDSPNALDFSHRNNIWRSLMLTPEERLNLLVKDIDKYVYVKEGTNLDAGTYDEVNKWVRYGSKHNDIYPRIGDLIRFKLSLSPRKQKGLSD